MNRKTSIARTLVLALSLTLGVAACKESTPDKTSFTAGPPIKLLETRLVSTGESSAAAGATSQVTWIIAKLEITNDGDSAWTPEVSHIYLITTQGTRIQAHDQGSVALIGISNSIAPIAKGEKREYTVGFATVESTPSGSITYDF